MSEPVQVSYPAAHVAMIVLDHPPMNTLDRASRLAMAEALATLDADLDVRCLVITGTGRAFTTGADLREEQEMGVQGLGAFGSEFSQVIRGVEHHRVPVIAAINGYCMGGGFELALGCDVRIASVTAEFAASGVNVGLIASFWRLPRIIGLGPAKEMLLTGATYRADQAEKWGLVTTVHQPDQLLPAAVALAERISSRAPLSVEAVKAFTERSLELTREEASRLQGDKFAELYRSEDRVEAIAAFIEKRPATFHRR
jgi:enoyl-CoA hydratase